MVVISWVDNATFVRSTLKAYLDESEHEVVSEASTGEDALSMLKMSDNPDVTVMNVSLPGMDGLEVRWSSRSASCDAPPSQNRACAIYAHGSS